MNLFGHEINLMKESTIVFIFIMTGFNTLFIALTFSSMSDIYKQLANIWGEFLVQLEFKKRTVKALDVHHNQIQKLTRQVNPLDPWSELSPLSYWVNLPETPEDTKKSDD